MKNNQFSVGIYDDTDWKSGLSGAWFAGGALYRLFGNLDEMRAVKSWDEVAAFLDSSNKKIDVFQFWGHGSPGAVYVNNKPLTVVDLAPEKQWFKVLNSLRSRVHAGSVVWFRCCSIFAGERGHKFAQEISNFLGCIVAAHTYIIGPLQSGLHTIRSGETPSWDIKEGLDKDGKMRWSGFFEPNTINCLQGTIPRGW